jgi:parvulin-like peptidyl-prolyl isomerase
MTAPEKAAIAPEEITQYLKQEIKFKTVWEQIWYQKVILQAAQERGITVTPEEIQEEADRQRLERRLEKAEDTFAWLEAQMIAPDDWEEGIRTRLLRQKLAEAIFSQDVEKYFAENRLDFEQITLYQFVVEDKAIAQELFYQIEEGEISFYEAARLYDIDEQRRQRCGLEGKVYRWRLSPDIAASVFSQPVGEVIGPLNTELGYHLLLVEEFIPAELTEERYQEILERLFQSWLVSELNYKLYDRVDDDALPS